MTATLLTPTAENLQLVARELGNGGLVAIPTETVYGLAGSAFDPAALMRIFETKDRPVFDPLIAHVSIRCRSLAALEAEGVVDTEPLEEIARKRIGILIERFWPGPLTLVLPKHEKIPDLMTSGLPTVAVRMPKHPVAQAILSFCGFPLAAPSANRFGRISPTKAQDVMGELGEKISWIVDGGACEIGVESTVIAVSRTGELSLFRPGGVPVAEIEKQTQAPVMRLNDSPGGEVVDAAKPALSSPGMLASHYAPSKPLSLLSKPVRDLETGEFPRLFRKKIGLLTNIEDPQAVERFKTCTGARDVLAISLSRDGNLAEAARNLFSSLRSLDDSDSDLIFAEPVTDTSGIGHAIADRLARASVKPQV